MSRLFFDTSALIKLYHDEEGTDIVDNLLSQDRSAVIVISDITLIEMVSTFAKKVRTHLINEGTFITVVAAFQKDARSFEVVSTDREIKSDAIRLLKTYGRNRGLRTLDALQLASAMEVNRQKPIDLFIAADKTLLAVAKQAFLPVFSV